MRGARGGIREVRTSQDLVNSSLPGIKFKLYTQSVPRENVLDLYKFRTMAFNEKRYFVFLLSALAEQSCFRMKHPTDFTIYTHITLCTTFLTMQ